MPVGKFDRYALKGACIAAGMNEDTGTVLHMKMAASVEQVLQA